MVSSRVEHRGQTRSRRLYKISESGLEAVTRWADQAPVDPPTLKHNALLRVTFGHLTNPGNLKEILAEHLAYVDTMHRIAAKEAHWSGVESAWAYARVALLWAKRYYASERELTLKMIDELDEAQAVFAEAANDPGGVNPWPPPEFWYEVEKKAEGEDTD